MTRLLTLLVILTTLGPLPVAAQTDDPWVGNGIIDHPSEVLDGSCTPDVLGALELTTCRFPLAEPGDVAPPWGIVAVVGGPFFDDTYARSECTVDGVELVCRDLLGGWQEGIQEVWLDIDGERPRAVVEIDRVNDGVLGFVGWFGRVPVAFTDAPRTFEVFRSFMLAPDDEASLRIAREGSDDVVAEVPALAAGEEDGVATVVFPEAGRWTMTPCLVDPAGGCAREGFTQVIQVVDPVVEPLFPDHNLDGAERIDLLFVGSGWHGDTDGFVGTARLLMSFDGEPVALGVDGVVQQGEAPIDLVWGPFAIDPLRGRQDLFNVWYLPEEVTARAFQISPTIDIGIDLAPLGLGPDVAVAILTRDLAFSSIRATAEWPSFRSTEPSTLPAIEDIRFGSTTMPYRFDGYLPADTFSHEIGHLLFGLADEYSRFSNDFPTIGYPNCAPSTEVAAEWWGDLIGDLDPMYEVWELAERAAGTWFGDSRANEFAVDVVQGGCFGGDSGAYRPTVSGLMNEESPVFGTVNRRRVEEVLALWSGKASFDPLQHAGLVEGVCDSDAVTDGVRVVCTGIADQRLDPPEAISLSLGDQGAACAWVPRDGADEIVCEGLSLAMGQTPTAAFVVAGTEIELGTVGIPTTTTTSTLPPPTTVPVAAPIEEPEPGVPRGVFIGAIALVGGAALLFGFQAVADRRREDVG
ncbi:MAG: hypothetical protein HKN46_08395 [Acidimicrobiia bacterium]|nr:hypothetical protein [Acidimicrobiia bacterium]